MKHKLLKPLNKYKNIREIVNGMMLDSSKEARRYQELLLREESGEITDLKVHEQFILQIGFTNKDGKRELPIIYEAGFYYYDPKAKCYVVEDTKGVRTEGYKIKRKMFMYGYPDIDFREV